MSVPYKIFNFGVKGDSRGSLIPVEGNNDIPFDIKRIYYVFGTQKNIVRGCHSHNKTKEIAVCISGSCDFSLDDGMDRIIVHLDDPSKGLYLQNNIWREYFNCSEDCIVLVLASECYDESDYIRDYDEFKKEVNK